jgi:hypothetical protein
MKKLNFYFIPSARVGYKEISVIKILYALLFVKSPEAYKLKTALFMKALADGSEDYNIAITLPQSFCKKIYQFAVKFPVPPFIQMFFAHVDGEKDRANIFSVMPMFYSDTFTISNKGWGTKKSVATELFTEYDDRTLNLITNYSKKKQTKFSTHVNSSPILNWDTVLVIMQLPWDETITQKSDLTWLEFADIVYNLAILNSDTNFRLRIHPLHQPVDLYRISIEKLLGLQNVALSDNELYEEFKHSRALILINSGVGFEALMYGRPVISYGDSIYVDFTCAVKAVNPKEINLLTMIEDAEKRLNFFHEKKVQFIRANLYCVADVEKFWITQKGSR